MSAATQQGGNRQGMGTVLLVLVPLKPAAQQKPTPLTTIALPGGVLGVETGTDGRRWQ